MWEALISHLLLWGNCYAQIQQTIFGDIQALWPLDPSRMKVKRENNEVIYEYTLTDNGEPVRFPSWEILHIAGLGFNGLIGYSVIQLIKESVGLGLAAEQFAGKFYSNGASPSGVLETDQPLLGNEENIRQMRKAWYDQYGGVSNSNKIAILVQGLKFKPITMPLKDSQFIESRNFQVREVSRWFDIPPHMIGDLSDAKWANIEAQSREFVEYTLTPWLVRIEQALKIKLLLGNTNYEIKHSVDGLLRGDTAARQSYYAAALTHGWMTINEVRELEELNPVEGGDEVKQQMQMVPAAEKSTDKDKPTNGKDEEMAKKLVEFMGRTSREIGDIRKRLPKQES